MRLVCVRDARRITRTASDAFQSVNSDTWQRTAVRCIWALTISSPPCPNLPCPAACSAAGADAAAVVQAV